MSHSSLLNKRKYCKRISICNTEVLLKLTMASGKVARRFPVSVNPFSVLVAAKIGYALDVMAIVTVKMNDLRISVLLASNAPVGKFIWLLAPFNLRIQY